MKPIFENASPGNNVHSLARKYERAEPPAYGIDAALPDNEVMEISFDFPRPQKRICLVNTATYNFFKNMEAIAATWKEQDDLHRKILDKIFWNNKDDGGFLTDLCEAGKLKRFNRNKINRL